jgi:hypothetical protein
MHVRSRLLKIKHVPFQVFDVTVTPIMFTLRAPRERQHGGERGRGRRSRAHREQLVRALAGGQSLGDHGFDSVASLSAGRPVSARHTSSRLGFPTEKPAISTPFSSSARSTAVACAVFSSYAVCSCQVART